MKGVGKGAILLGSVALWGMVTGCASMSNRTKTLTLMALAGSGGAIAGAAITPAGESVAAHGALWGGVAAATAGVIGLFVFDEQAKSHDLEARNERLTKELASFRDGLDPELISASNLGMSKPLPDRFKHLVTPGQWSLYKVDRWVTSSESELVHQDLIFRFHQPQLNPAAKSGGNLNEGDPGK